MNKVILFVALIAVGLSGWNTFLLLQITDAIRSAGKEIAPVAKQLEKIQPVLQKLSEQPTGAPPAPLPKETKADVGIEPKGKPPLPPGLPPKD